MDSYDVFPIATPPPIEDFAAMAVTLVAGSFDIGFKVSMPFMLTALLLFFRRRYFIKAYAQYANFLCGNSITNIY